MKTIVNKNNTVDSDIKEIGYSPSPRRKKRYKWNVERFICNMSYTLLVLAYILGIMYVLYLEGTSISLY